jgi:acylphosphatase
MAEKIAKRYIIKGNVQGVGYRYFTINIANSIGLYGYVENLYNGDVEVYAIGEVTQLEALKQHLFKGPSYSNVVDIIETNAQVDNNLTGFHVEY